MRIGIDGDVSRRIDLEAWAAQIAAMHASVSRMSPTAQPGQDAREQGVPSVGAAETVRAQVLSSRQSQMSAQDGLGYLQVAGADLERSQEVLRRMRVVATQAADGSFDAPQREALQKYVDRSVQELEGIAEQARYHTLRMLGGTAASWALPERSAAAAWPASAVVAPALAGRAAGPAEPPPAAPVAPGVGPSAPVSPHAVPPATRPDPAFGAGYEPRPTPGIADGIGVFASAAAPARPAQESGGARTGPAERGAGGPLGGRAPVGSAEQARGLVRRIDTATDVLAAVGAAVDAAEQSVLRTIGELGLGHERLPGEGTPTPAASDATMRQLLLQTTAQSSAAVLVEATRAQFDAVTTVLGGTTAAASVGAQVTAPPREAAMAPRPAVEPVTTTTRSSRAESGRERNDRGGAAGGGVPRR